MSNTPTISRTTDTNLNTKSDNIFDVVIPSNNEEVFINTALELNYTKIVFLTNNINYKLDTTKIDPKKLTKIELKTAYLIKDSSEIAFARKRFNYIFAIAERKYFESKVDFIIYSEESERRDSFHYRATSLNQVHAQLSKDNNSSIVINFGALLTDTKNIRLIFGRMNQNAKLIKKYKLTYNTFSLAKSPELMRSKIILSSLENVLKL